MKEMASKVRIFMYRIFWLPSNIRNASLKPRLEERKRMAKYSVI
jgi:hypothetical protein